MRGHPGEQTNPPIQAQSPTARGQDPDPGAGRGRFQPGGWGNTRGTPRLFGMALRKAGAVWDLASPPAGGTVVAASPGGG